MCTIYGLLDAGNTGLYLTNSLLNTCYAGLKLIHSRRDRNIGHPRDSCIYYLLKPRYTGLCFGGCCLNSGITCNGGINKLLNSRDTCNRLSYRGGGGV